MKDGTHSKVLVVDDDPDFLSLLSAEMMRIPNVDVAVANGPGEAVELLTQNRYHLIVSDWALNSSTAPEVFTRADQLINEESGKVPVVFISGSEKVSQTQVLKRLKHFEPVSFLIKRCGPALIRLFVEMILASFPRRKVLQPC